MAIRETIGRHHRIIQKLRHFQASFDEIIFHLETESEIWGYNYVVSKRTFQRDLNDIRTLYGIDIRHDANTQSYFIHSKDNDDTGERLLEAFDMINLLNKSENMARHVHLENRKPSGTRHLTPILEAIKKRKNVTFDYHKFQNEQHSSRKLSPLGLKEFRNRWYVLGIDTDDGNIKNFGLDRITRLQLTKEKFKRPNEFNLKRYFKDSFGVSRPINSEPIEIVLSFSHAQGKYIKSLPLHKSQKILIDNEKELRISIFVYPTHDLWMEIQSMGKQVTVVSPKNLGKQLVG